MGQFALGPHAGYIVRAYKHEPQIVFSPRPPVATYLLGALYTWVELQESHENNTAAFSKGCCTLGSLNN